MTRKAKTLESKQKKEDRVRHYEHALHVMGA